MLDSPAMRSLPLIAVATVMVIALVALATLQMRWIDELAAGEEQRERDAIDFAARHFADDVERELMRVRNDFGDASVDDLPQRIAEQPSPLIGDLYVVHAWREGPTLDRIDPATGRFSPADWPPHFEAVRRAAHPVSQHPPLIDEIPAFLLPVRPPPPERDPMRPPGMRPPPMVLVVTINRDALNALFAETAKRDVEGYDVAVADGDAIAWRSSPQWPQSPDDKSELMRPLLMMRPPDSGPPHWRLLLRRHGAPMADVVAAARRRNAMVSIAVLAVLAGAFILVALIARRAEMLRRQQLAFVAGITHELNTPLAAIESAGENLADGIVIERDHVVRYGNAIVKEARRLSDIVAQVLTYAGMQARSAQRTHEALDVAPIVTSAVASCAWIAEQSGVTVETTIADDLPRVDGNREELISAIRNLVTNAIRHGGDGRWVGVRATAERDDVVITVEDRGRGVAARDLPRLFEPFYRGRNAYARGAGLGLAIVQQIAAAHGGSVSAEKRRERGAAFTLRLPAPAVQHA